MVRITPVALLAVAYALAAPSAYAAGPFGKIHVGLWNGGAYTDDHSGAFSHCAASSRMGVAST